MDLSNKKPDFSKIGIYANKAKNLIKTTAIDVKTRVMNNQAVSELVSDLTGESESDSQKAKIAANHVEPEGAFEAIDYIINDNMRRLVLENSKNYKELLNILDFEETHEIKSPVVSVSSNMFSRENLIGLVKQDYNLLNNINNQYHQNMKVYVRLKELIESWESTDDEKLEIAQLLLSDNTRSKVRSKLKKMGYLKDYSELINGKVVVKAFEDMEVTVAFEVMAKLADSPEITIKGEVVDYMTWSAIFGTIEKPNDRGIIRNKNIKLDASIFEKKAKEMGFSINKLTTNELLDTGIIDF